MKEATLREKPLIVLGVTGSIAAYRAADIASQLVKAGCEVRVVMTEGAARFITPLTLRTLSRNPVIAPGSEHGTGGVDEVDWESGWKPAHIALADEADLLLVAPATANIIAEFALGLASHPLAEIALATHARILIAPAMNGKMWLHPATAANVKTLGERGVEFIGPEAGLLACGYEGVGRLWPVEKIVAHAVVMAMGS